MDDGKFEWCGDSLKGLFAQPTNVISPAFYMMMRDVVRFNKEARALLHLREDDARRRISVAEFLCMHGLSEAFAKYYLVPMTGAIWSASSNDIMNFPIITLLMFLENHLLLQVAGHQQWITPSGKESTAAPSFSDTICRT
jgi:predicted NAD/FAD-binding protein